jgi:hypothetical protein
MLTLIFTLQEIMIIFLLLTTMVGKLSMNQNLLQNPEVEDVGTEAGHLVNSDQIDDLETPGVDTAGDDDLDTPGVGIAGNGTNHQQNTYNLRPRRERTYDHLYDPATHYTMTQYPVKKGIRLFGSWN